MNQTADKINTNDNPQSGPTAPLTTKERVQAPSPEVKTPFVPGKKKTERDEWKAILVGVALLAVITVAALTHKSGLKPSTSLAPNSRHPATGDQQAKNSPYGSATPINDIGNNSDKSADASKIGPGAIANTAKPRPVTTTAPNLGEVPAFNPTSWQPAPYQGAPSAGITEQQEDKSERDALDKASLVFVRNNSSMSGTPSSPTNGASQVDLGVGLAPGTRMRAHLESAVSTAVKTPVVAVIEYNYERDGEILIPAGAKVIGQLESADRSGYIGVRFDILLMPDGTTMNIEAAATDLQLRPLRGKVQGKNTGKNILVRSFAGIGEVMATLVGQRSLNQSLSEADLLRGRVASNIGQVSDEEVGRLATTEHLVVSILAGTEIYVVLEKGSRQPVTAPARLPTGNSTTIDQLRQLLQLQRELNQNTSVSGTSQ